MSFSNFDSEINSILNDKSHGSTFLLNAIIESFLRYLPNEEEIRTAWHKLKTMDRSMHVIHHFLNALESAIGPDFFEALKRYKQQWESLPEKMTKRLANLLKAKEATLLLHSHSGMVIQVLNLLKKQGFQPVVLQTHSVPGGEGKMQARELETHGINAQLIRDDEIDEYIPGIHAAFLGTDQFDAFSFVNKTGTSKIVDLCKWHTKRVYLASDPRKKVDKASAHSKLFELVGFAPHIYLLE